MRFLPMLAAVFATALCAESLQDNLHTRIGNFPGTVTLYAKNLDTGDSVGIRESDPVRTASTIKLPIMLAVFDAVARGQLKWTDPLTVNAAEKVSGSGILASEISDGVLLPLSDILHLMMVLSDNTATNMILQRFPADSVNSYLDKIGIKNTRALRKIRGGGSDLKSAPGWSTAGKLPENQKFGLGVSTPRDMVVILEKLERGEIVSPDASREMIGILKRCRDDSGIRRRVGDVPVANKTGALDALRADVGIVYSKGGRIAMAITVDGMQKTDYTPDNVGCLMIADLAKMLVEGLAKR
jgi:beta-lactamase class A